MNRIFLLFILLTLGMEGMTASAQTLAQAKSWYGEGDYEKAKPVFARLVKSYPNNGNYNLWYGVCCLKTGDAVGAVPCLEKAVKRRTTGGQLYLGQAYNAVYRYEEAVETFEAYRADLVKRKRSTAEADSLRRLSGLQDAAIDSLQNLLDRMEARLENRTRSVREAEAKPVDPKQAAADSIADLQLRLQRKQIESTFDTHGLTVLDTLDSGNDALHVILYANNTWKYVRNRAVAKDSTIFEKYWDTTSLFPYQEVDMSSMPQSVVIDLVDSTKSYHYPYKGAVNPRGKYGPRRGRRHQGVDLPLKTGDSIYATFCGRVRISKYVRGYGNLVIIPVRQGARRVPTSISKPVTTGRRSTPNG